MPKTTTAKTAKAVKKKLKKEVKKIKPIINKIKKPPIGEKKILTGENKKIRIFDFIIFSSLFLIFLLCPLFFTGLSAQGIIFEKIILFYFLVLIGTAAWIIKMASQGEIKFKRTALDLPIFFSLAVFIISAIMSVNQWTSLTGSYGNSAKGLMGFVVFILFYYLIVNNTNQKKIKILFWAMIFSFSAMLVFSLLQILGIFILPFSFTRSANFNPAGSLFSLSKLAVIALPILIFAASKSVKENNKTILLRWVLIVVSLIGFVILAALNKIVFWPAAIAGMAVLLFFVLLNKVKVSNNNLIITITAFLLMVIFFVLGNLNIENINIADDPALSYGESLNIAKESLKENPFFGSGPASFYYDFSKFKSKEFNMSQFWNLRFTRPAGFIFDILANVGILGILTVLIMAIAAFFYLWKSILKNAKTEAENFIPGLFSSLTAAAAIALFAPVGDYIILMAVIIGSLACAAASNGQNAKEISARFKAVYEKNYFSAVIFIVGLAGVAVMLVFSAKICLADFYASRALKEEDANKQIENLNRAVRLAPKQDIYRINLANSYIIYANQTATDENSDKNKILNNLKKSVSEARTATEIAPEKAANNEFLALVYEKAAYYEGLPAWSRSIKEAYGKMAELEPTNPVSYYKIALINMAEANNEQDKAKKNILLDQAIENYNKAISLKSDLAPAYYGKGIANEKRNNINGAIEELKNAVEKSGGNIDYAFELGRVYFNRGLANAEPAEVEAVDEDGEGAEEGETAQTNIKRNEDLNTANQIFLSILQVEPNHANALYSLALIYQAVGEPENIKITVDKLLNLISDEKQKEKIRQQFKNIL